LELYMSALLKNLQAFPVPQPDWQLQDAKNRFSQVVRAAQSGVPQWVTVHGKRAVVVLSGDEYEEFAQTKTEAISHAARQKPVQSLLEALRGDGEGLGMTDAEVDALFARDRGPWRASEARL
jgi:prevent-host-death family protein